MNTNQLFVWKLNENYVNYSPLHYSDFTANEYCNENYYDEVLSQQPYFDEIADFSELCAYVSEKLPIEYSVKPNVGDIVIYICNDAVSACLVTVEGYKDVSQIFSEMLYYVEITETLQKTVPVFATSEQSATSLVDEMYSDELITLCSDNCTGVDMNTRRGFCD